MDGRHILAASWSPREPLIFYYIGVFVCLYRCDISDSFMGFPLTRPPAAPCPFCTPVRPRPRRSTVLPSLAVLHRAALGPLLTSSGFVGPLGMPVSGGARRFTKGKRGPQLVSRQGCPLLGSSVGFIVSPRGLRRKISIFSNIAPVSSFFFPFLGCCPRPCSVTFSSDQIL